MGLLAEKFSPSTKKKKKKNFFFGRPTWAGVPGDKISSGEGQQKQE
jgi:hypothetical protein